MAAPRGLHALARLHGVQTAYRSNEGARVGATPEGLMAALRALRVPAESAGDIPRLLSHRRRQLAERVLEPVVVAWHQRPAPGGGGTGPGPVRGEIRLRLPARLADARLAVVVGLEEGGERRWRVAASSLEPVEEMEVDGRSYVTVRAPLPDLPTGYHDLTVEAAGRRWEALLIVAPRRAASWEAVSERPAWGLFAPLYALREEDRPVPDFGLLDRMAERVARHGGAVVGTLPVLAAFLDRPYEPSPYAPASRLFWNEVYADPAAAPALDRLSDDERALLPGRGSTPAAADLRWFDAGAAMAARRRALEALARAFFADDPEAELAAFRARNPRVEDYARFRALTSARGPWGEWPDRLRARDVRRDDYDEAEARYHVYVQWLAERQLAAATERAADRGVSLYLDLPLGVHPAGYDVWRERALFARGASAGAPPDPLARQGQDWGFPPLHPEASRLDRHRYFVACIRKHLRFAKVLRIDHVMQLHRMFWVPAGDARDGVYVRYPAEELYAVLCLESRRAGAVLVGEDLGTVPSAVRRDMKRHGLYGMYVAQFELRQDAKGSEDARLQGAKGGEGAKGTAARSNDAKGVKALVPGPVPGGAVASVGTHDTPTFMGWWTGRDAEIRGEEGFLSDSQVSDEVRGRGVMREELVRGLRGPPGSGTAEPQSQTGEGAGAGESAGAGATEAEAMAVLRGLHGHMGRSGAGLVLANMEDLWLEAEPQNVPGTTGERNWRRRSARPLEALDGGRPAWLLRELHEARREAE